MNYPFIADKKMYGAVMFACKMIRETGYRNKAIQTASNYYGVDSHKLEQHITDRQKAGQKNKSKTSTSSGRSYKYFLVAKYCFTEAHGEYDIIDVEVVKALSSENATKRFFDSDLRETMLNDYGGSYAPSFSHHVVGNKEGYPSKQDVIQALNKLFK